MACDATPSRIVTIAHGAVNKATAMGGSYQETVTIAETYPANRKAPCAYLRTYSLRAFAKYHEFATPVVRGTKDSLVYTLETIAGNTVTVTLANMRQAGNSSDMESQEFSMTDEYVYDSGTSDNLAPITVS